MAIPAKNVQIRATQNISVDVKAITATDMSRIFAIRIRVSPDTPLIRAKKILPTKEPTPKTDVSIARASAPRPNISSAKPGNKSIKGLPNME